MILPGSTGSKHDNNKTYITERQYECLALRAQHYTNQEISEKLGLSKRTVESHLDKARLKLAYGISHQESLRAFIDGKYAIAPPKIKKVILKKIKFQEKITGKTFGNWKIIEKIEGYNYYCECLACNKVYVRDVANISLGRSTGCRDCYLKRPRRKQKRVLQELNPHK